MISLKQTLLVFVFLSAFVGTAQQSHTEYSVKNALKEGFVKFVENVRPLYSNGDTYLQFKQKVILGEVKPNNYTLPPVPIEGENLIKKAYLSLEAKYTSKQLLEQADYKTYGKAILYINDTKNNTNKTVSEAEAALFGGNEQLLNNNPLIGSTRGVCKWWQLWCHLDQVFGGSGGSQILQAIIIVIITLL